MNQHDAAYVGPKTEFVRLQLEVDALLNIPGDHNIEGATGPEDKYVAFGRDWVRFYFTGCYFAVREYARPGLKPYADLTLDLPDCIDGLARILADLKTLKTLDADEFAKAADGVFRARRRALQDNSERSTRTGRDPEHGPVRQSQTTDVRCAGEEPRLARGHEESGDRQFAVRLHAAATEIEALRNADVDPDGSHTPVSNPQKVRLLAQAWAVYYVTGLAHTMGGTQGDAMASIADPNISPDQCIKGLNRVRDRLTRLTPTEREATFARIDDAYDHYTPKFDSELA